MSDLRWFSVVIQIPDVIFPTYPAQQPTTALLLSSDLNFTAENSARGIADRLILELVIPDKFQLRIFLQMG